MSLLSKLTREAPALPSRVVLYAAEGMGKTSFACHAPAPAVLMTAGETGLLSLVQAGRVPAPFHFPDDFRTWAALVEAVRAFVHDRHEFKTLVLDTGNGAEALCAAAVCEDKFGGDWKAYHDYGRGVREAVPVWADFLALLGELNARRRMAVLVLHHARVKKFENPTGKDWEQWQPEAIDKLWSLTHKWADVIAFYGLRVGVNREDKASGAETRYLRLAPSAAVVAKNRYGLPDELAPPPGAANLWRAFAEAIQKAKGGGKPAAAPQQQPAGPAAAADPLAGLAEEYEQFGHSFEEWLAGRGVPSRAALAGLSPPAREQVTAELRDALAPLRERADTAA